MVDTRDILVMADRIVVLERQDKDHSHPFGVVVDRVVRRDGSVRWGVFRRCEGCWDGEPGDLLNKVHGVWQKRCGYRNEKPRLDEETLWESPLDAHAAAMEEAEIVRANDRAGYDALLERRQEAMAAAGITKGDYEEPWKKPPQTMKDDALTAILINPASLLVLPLLFVAVPMALTGNTVWSAYGTWLVKGLFFLGAPLSLWMVVGRQFLGFDQDGGLRLTLCYLGVAALWFTAALLVPWPILPPAAWLLLDCPPAIP